MLSGGDYSKGVEGCGPAVAVSLAQCGFGDSLVQKIRSLSLSITLGLRASGAPGSKKASKTRVTLGKAEEDELKRWLETWREDLCRELETNSRKLMKKKRFCAWFYEAISIFRHRSDTVCLYVPNVTRWVMPVPALVAGFNNISKKCPTGHSSRPSTGCASGRRLNSSVRRQQKQSLGCGGSA